MAVCLKVSRSELLAPFPQFLISKLLGDFRGDEINRRTHTRIHRPSLTEWKRTPPGCQAICGYGLRCPRLWTNALADNNMLADNNALTNNDDTQGTVLFQLRFYSRYAFIPALLSRAVSAKTKSARKYTSRHSALVSVLPRRDVRLGIRLFVRSSEAVSPARRHRASPHRCRRVRLPFARSGAQSRSTNRRPRRARRHALK